jgi:purine-binding chemotaxis protein CheW
MATKRTTGKPDITPPGSTAAEPHWRTGKDAHLVILQSGDGYFGIDISIVQEIVPLPPITKVPGCAPYIAGLTDLRGRVIPVADFATILGNEPSERTDETRVLVVEHGGDYIGLIVDAVTEVMMVDGEQIEDVMTIGVQDHDFILAVARLEGHLVSLVDVDRLLVAASKDVAAKAA